LRAPLGGDAIRIMGISEALALTSEVTVAAPIGSSIAPPGCELLECVTVTRRGRLPTLVRMLTGSSYHTASFKIDMALGRLGRSWDLCYLHLPRSWSVMHALRPLIAGQPVIVDLQNDDVDMWRQRWTTGPPTSRWLAHLAARNADRELRTILDSANLIVVPTEIDRRTAANTWAAAHADRLVVVPNGVDVSAWRPPLSDWPDTSADVVFVASLDVKMNQRAVQFLSEVARICASTVPTARFVVAGRNPPRWMVKSAMNWTVIANPPDVRPLLWSARLAVGPFVVGGGSKIKLIEAMAAGAPVVATDAGVQGLSVVPGIHYVPSGPSPEEFARAIASVFHASDRLRQLRAAGLDLAAGMDWRRSFAAFPDLLQLARAAGSQSFSRQS